VGSSQDNQSGEEGNANQGQTKDGVALFHTSEVLAPGRRFNNLQSY
jgi:hypothetical protein